MLSLLHEDKKACQTIFEDHASSARYVRQSETETGHESQALG
jgi:hypothetical protein